MKKKHKTKQKIADVCERTLEYLMRSQDFTAGEYYGSFWSEKAYHGPLLNYHAGGSHHNRTAGSAGLAMWLVGLERNDRNLQDRAEAAFDWAAARQRPSGGYYEIQNNEKPSDWELTGLEECSTIELAAVIHGLGNALLKGLPPKKMYGDCLQKAGHWLLSIEMPAGSGIFPHHERSPYDCLNANMFASESLALIYTVMSQIYGRNINIFLEGYLRALRHTLELQWPNGCFPYRANQGSTINYSVAVAWCILNIVDIFPENLRHGYLPTSEIDNAIRKVSAFLYGCIDSRGRFLWDKYETSSAKHNLAPSVLALNVLVRIGGRAKHEGGWQALELSTYQGYRIGTVADA